VGQWQTQAGEYQHHLHQHTAKTLDRHPQKHQHQPRQGTHDQHTQAYQHPQKYQAA